MVAMIGLDTDEGKDRVELLVLGEPVGACCLSGEGVEELESL